MEMKITINGVDYIPDAASLNNECYECDLNTLCTNVDSCTDNSFSRVCNELIGSSFAFKIKQ